MKEIFIIILFAFVGYFSEGQTLIPLGPANIINLNNKVGDANYTQALLDEQGADPLNGIVEPVPKTAFSSGYTTHTGYPAVIGIDLKQAYNLTNINLYSNYGVDSINFEFSADGTSYTDKKTYHPSGIGFFSYKINEKAKYIKVYNSNKGYQKVMEAYFYGTPAVSINAPLPTTVMKTFTIELMSDSSFRVVE